MNRTLGLVGCLCALLVSAPRLEAQAPGTQTERVGASAVTIADAAQEQAQAEVKKPAKKRSPWMASPLVSSSPKMGTSVGGLGAYLHYFDPESDVSLFGGMFQYSTTNSMAGGLFARTSFSADHQRLEGIVGFGYVENEYEDFQGTGEPLNTTDDLRLFASRYLYRFKGDWFAGTQAIFANYVVSGMTSSDQLMLDAIGISGYNSGGVGITLMHDSRDNPDMPVKGWYADAANIANSRALGAEEDYQWYRVDFRSFLQHGKGHVLALRQFNQFTYGAPASAESTINLRGYKMQQYLGKHVSSIEIEERLRFSRRWGATLFAGVGWLYGGSAGEADSDGAYPSVGGGIHFILKPEDHMLVNLEYAYGNSDNQGIYLKFGYTW